MYGWGMYKKILHMPPSLH